MDIQQRIPASRHPVTGRARFPIVAEIGINHNGSVELAKGLILAAWKAGAWCVKFQMRTVPVVYAADYDKPRDVPVWFLQQTLERLVLNDEESARLGQLLAAHAGGEEDTISVPTGWQKWGLEFTGDEYQEIHEYCKAMGIAWTASPWDEGAVDLLASFDPPFIKVASASLTDDGLLRHIRSKGKPVALSTGGSTMEQIRHAVEVLGQEDLILLQCTAAYPSDSTDALDLTDLRVMDTFADEFPGVPIGFSSNYDSRIPALFAAVRGARGVPAAMVEVHLTLRHDMWGSDQASSMEPPWFADLCEWASLILPVLGDGNKTVYPAERAVMGKLRRVG